MRTRVKTSLTAKWAGCKIPAHWVSSLRIDTENLEHECTKQVSLFINACQINTQHHKEYLSAKQVYDAARANAEGGLRKYKKELHLTETSLKARIELDKCVSAARNLMEQKLVQYESSSKLVECLQQRRSVLNRLCDMRIAENFEHRKSR